MVFFAISTTLYIQVVKHATKIVTLGSVLRLLPTYITYLCSKYMIPNTWLLVWSMDLS
jgi:hypothetical protein